MWKNSRNVPYIVRKWCLSTGEVVSQLSNRNNFIRVNSLKECEWRIRKKRKDGFNIYYAVYNPHEAMSALTLEELILLSDENNTTD